jgi:hypothetical protein
VGDAVVPVAESPPNLPLQAALVNDLCSVQNGRSQVARGFNTGRRRCYGPTHRQNKNSLAVHAELLFVVCPASASALAASQATSNQVSEGARPP